MNLLLSSRYDLDHQIEQHQKATPHRLSYECHNLLVRLQIEATETHPPAESVLNPLVSLVRSEGFLGGHPLSTNILPLRGIWLCPMHARLKKVADILPFGSCEDRL
jgi:hypothetical protein